MLPEVKDFNNPKICDILNSVKLSKTEISDSISQIWHMFGYIENISNSLTCQKPEI